MHGILDDFVNNVKFSIKQQSVACINIFCWQILFGKNEITVKLSWKYIDTGKNMWKIWEECSKLKFKDNLFSKFKWKIHDWLASNPLRIKA